jgi:hypothetical protein
MSKLPLVIALAFSCVATPVLAADPAPASSSNSLMSDAGAVGARAASVAAGTVLGMPVAAVRVFANCDVEHAKAIPLIGESTHKGFVWLSRGIVIPTAAFVTLFATPIHSSINAWRGSSEKPFSKEAFSLGRFDESITPP